MVNAKKLELINELKQLRKQKNITYQEIADKTEENGESVSLSTVKKVFSDNYQHDHDYNNVLLPIMNVLVPIEEGNLELHILQTRLELKNEMIRQLNIRLEKKENSYRRREDFIMDQLYNLRQQIEFDKEQIQFKDSQIKRLNEAIDRKDKMIREKLIGED